MPTRGRCARCGRMFFKRNPVHTFCPACIDDAKSRNVSLNRCKECGKIFEAVNKSETIHNRTVCKECRNKDKPKYICPKCGQLFAKRTLGQNFCDDCIAEGKRGGWSYHKCRECGAVFIKPRRKDGHENNAPYCDDCRWIQNEKKNGLRRALRARRREEKAQIMIPKRRCHDCGKPTYSYRCPECQARWRQENDVTNEYDSRRRANQEAYNIYI